MNMNAVHQSTPSHRRRLHKRAVRVLTAVPLCDGHDSAIMTINLELVRHGIEVIYLGYHRSVADIVRAAIQEDARAIGLSSYNGGHVEFFGEVLHRLRRRGAGDIGLFGGGGATITGADAKLMKRSGVDQIFFPGSSLAEMVEFVKRTYGSRSRTYSARNGQRKLSDRQIAKALSAVEAGGRPAAPNPQRSTPVIGITGPGGAGKTTLIDELTLRFFKAHPQSRLAILSHDPSLARAGALLGDRATMVYAQDDRVFMRSLATGGKAGGLSMATRGCLEVLRHSGFDVVLVESAGIGQEAAPFARGLADKQVLVMSPDYGSRLQLQKILMLEAADVVTVNKSELPAARTAISELEQRLALNGKGQKLIATVAKRHRDPGVDELFDWLDL